MLRREKARSHHTNVNIHISAIGRYEDELVKRDGKWLILECRRTECEWGAPDFQPVHQTTNSLKPM